MSENYVTKELYDAHIRDSETKYAEFRTEIAKIWQELGGKASYVIVWVLMGIITSLLGVIWYAQQQSNNTLIDVQINMATVQRDIGSINKTLDQAEVTNK